jgi:hypothetical protein
VKLSVSKYASTFLLLFCALTTTPSAQTKVKKQKSDWDTYFGAGIAPPYTLTGTLRVRHSSDHNYSYTNSDGETASFHCSSNSAGTDCYDGTGIYRELILETGEFVFIGSTWDSRDAPIGWILDSTPHDLGFVDGKVFHARWKTDPYASSPLLCIHPPGLDAVPNGKALRKYAKMHRMETCYIADIEKR